MGVGSVRSPNSRFTGPFRILIVQDREATRDEQRKEIEYAATRARLEVNVETHDLKDPSSRVLSPLKSGKSWFDWVLSDLLIDEQERCITSTGLRLLRELADSGLFGKYESRGPNAHSVRCIAISSVCVDDGKASSQALADILHHIGVLDRYLYNGGSHFDEIAQDLVAEMQRSRKAR